MDTEQTLNNFTPRAQQVLALARREADRFHHNFVGTEHLLLGLIRLGQGVAVNVLQKMGLDLETVRVEVEKQVGTGPDQKMIGNIPYTPRVKKVLALAAKEAKALNHTYVGTEHVLLGLMREGDGVAARVLKNLEVDVEHTRLEILKELDPNFSGDNYESRAVLAKETVPVRRIPSPTSQESQTVDISKRYDVYCADGNREVVVYRKARFKGTRKLFQQHSYDGVCAYIELELTDGSVMCLARNSIVKFCESGPDAPAESVSGPTPEK